MIHEGDRFPRPVLGCWAFACAPLCSPQLASLSVPRLSGPIAVGSCWHQVWGRTPPPLRATPEGEACRLGEGLPAGLLSWMGRVWCGAGGGGSRWGRCLAGQRLKNVEPGVSHQGVGAGEHAPQGGWAPTEAPAWSLAAFRARFRKSQRRAEPLLHPDLGLDMEREAGRVFHHHHHPTPPVFQSRGRRLAWEPLGLGWLRGTHNGAGIGGALGGPVCAQESEFVV